MRKLILGAIVAAALFGCGGGGGDSHADVCERCERSDDATETCIPFCEEGDTECIEGCRTCGEGLYCTIFTFIGSRCAIDDDVPTCCSRSGSQQVPCD